MDEDFRKAALGYHRLPRPGKLRIEPTRRMASQRDLTLAGSPDAAFDATARGNLNVSARAARQARTPPPEPV